MEVMFYHLPVAAAALSMASSCSGAATEAARARAAGRWTAVSLSEADRARCMALRDRRCVPGRSAGGASEPPTVGGTVGRRCTGFTT